MENEPWEEAILAMLRDRQVMTFSELLGLVGGGSEGRARIWRMLADQKIEIEGLNEIRLSSRE